jgi:acyl-CoA reductase-like NAD-dependent aldehyde dehydrogenase
MITATKAKIAPGRLLIDGRWVDGGHTFNTINPATGEVLTQIVEASAADVDGAVEAARRAFDAKGAPWRMMPASERARLIWRLADLLEKHIDELAELETLDNGKPIFESRNVDMPMVIDVLRYYAGWATKIHGETVNTFDSAFTYTLREPVGVVGLIIPWNFPLLLASWKLGPALACGNTIVMKPAEQTPLTTLRLGELAIEAGLPNGVLNIVTGGPKTGQAIVQHPGIDKIAFTGSTAVGKEIMRSAADTLKRVTLELGGKSPNLVFADADLEAAAASAPMAVFGNAGQDCCARSRILVQRPVLDRFMDALADAVESIRVGDPLDPDTQMGPLISAGHRERVSSFVNGDAPVAVRGTAPQGPGYWFAPTVLCPVDPDSRAAREEIFGPVATVIPFDDEEDAVRLANDTIYGLSGSIWTRDGARALRVARAIDTGVLSINSNTSVRVATPFGGFKQSGYGRELGPHALDAYTEVKSIYYVTS